VRIDSGPVFSPLQARQQQGDQSQKDFIGKGDEVRDDQVKDKKAQEKGQESRVAKPGSVLEDTISKHVVGIPLTPLKGRLTLKAGRNNWPVSPKIIQGYVRSSAKAEPKRIFRGGHAQNMSPPSCPVIPNFLVTPSTSIIYP